MTAILTPLWQELEQFHRFPPDRFTQLGRGLGVRCTAPAEQPGQYFGDRVDAVDHHDAIPIGCGFLEHIGVMLAFVDPADDAWLKAHAHVDGWWFSCIDRA